MRQVKFQIGKLHFFAEIFLNMKLLIQYLHFQHMDSFMGFMSIIFVNHSTKALTVADFLQESKLFSIEPIQ